MQVCEGAVEVVRYKCCGFGMIEQRALDVLVASGLVVVLRNSF